MSFLNYKNKGVIMTGSTYVAGGRITYASREKPIRAPKSFSQQQVELQNIPLFFISGFEKLFLAIYFISLPYIAGLFFLFFHIAKGKPEVFLSLNDESSFILTWAIGYEIIATLILLYIAKSAVSFTMNNHKRSKKHFQRP
jgi:hypothetical protein